MLFGAQHFQLRILVMSGLMASLALSVLAASPTPRPAYIADNSAANKVQMAQNYGKLPLSFEANRGQSDPQVRFISRGRGYSLFLMDTAAVLSLTKRSNAQTGTIRMELDGASPNARATGADQLPGTANYFIGNDPTKWRTGAPTYAKVRYTRIYPGVNLVYYGNQQQLEYDFIIAPGADPKPIRLHFVGAKALRVDKGGNLIIAAPNGDVSLRKPSIYQDFGGERRQVKGQFALLGARKVGFALGDYDHSKPLVIDPVLQYSTLLGSKVSPEAIAVDAEGNAYLTGSVNFVKDMNGNTTAYLPVTTGAFQSQQSELQVGFVSKFNATGTALMYSTFLGGSVDDAGTSGEGISVDSEGNAYVTGYTSDIDFPVSKGAFQANLHSRTSTNAFVTKFNSTGTALLYSTYLGGGGTDYGYGIAVDKFGYAYLTGQAGSSDFPVTPDAFQGANNATAIMEPNAFVTKLNLTGTALEYSTYLGGSNTATGKAISLDASGNAYVTGQVESPDFPVTAGAFQVTNKEYTNGFSYDAFVTKINPTGTSLVYSTYLGGSNSKFSGEVGYGIAVDSSGDAFVTGSTGSTDFPVTEGAFQTTNKAYGSAYGSAFVTKFNATGTALVYSTFLGGTDTEYSGDISYGIALDSAGDVYVTGQTNEDDFPITKDAYQSTNHDALLECIFVTEINPTGTALEYSTYLGGTYSDVSTAIAVDNAGGVYVTGATSSSDFPTTAGAFQTSGAGAFVSKFALGNSTSIGTQTSLSSSGRVEV
jgi:hypothetical protein